MSRRLFLPETIAFSDARLIFRHFQKSLCTIVHLASPMDSGAHLRSAGCKAPISQLWEWRARNDS
jgi:hypothetical protein